MILSHRTVGYHCRSHHALASRRVRRYDPRFNLTIIGSSVLMIAVTALISGDHRGASMGFILRGAIVVGNEWWYWRKRQ